MRITRHFVSVGERRVHYHRAGDGPAVAMLHASPCSAKVMRLPQETFATRFTAIAFDSPGFGLSDPLALERPEIGDVADATAAALAVLGIEHAASYGRHTGAQIAIELAARHPARIAMALTDGYPLFSPDMDWSKVEAYLVPFVPVWDGTHLVWAWYRYREQHMFWPWNARSLANRADTDVPTPEFLHRGVIELLEAGDGYRPVYAAAFRHRGAQAFADLKVPACFGARRGDSLFTHLALVPETLWRAEVPREAHAAARAELEILGKHPARGVPPAPPRPAPLAGRTTLDYVDLGDAQVLVRSIGNLRRGTPIVVIHHAPGSSALYDELVCRIGAEHPVIALDLPGHGESDAHGPQSVEGWAAAVLATLDRLGVGPVQLYGHNGGAAVAIEIAARARDRVRAMTLDAPVLVESAIGARWLEGVLPVTPVWDGSHLLRVWHMRRDMELWWPWNMRRREHARRTAPRIDPARLMLEVREILKQPASFAPAWQALFAYPLGERLARSHARCAIIAAPEDVFADALADARSLRPDARAIEITDDAASRARAVLAMRDA